MSKKRVIHCQQDFSSGTTCYFLTVHIYTIHCEYTVSIGSITDLVIQFLLKFRYLSLLTCFLSNFRISNHTYKQFTVEKKNVEKGLRSVLFSWRDLITLEDFRPITEGFPRTSSTLKSLETMLYNIF